MTEALDGIVEKKSQIFTFFFEIVLKKKKRLSGKSRLLLLSRLVRKSLRVSLPMCWCGYGGGCGGGGCGGGGGGLK